MTSPVRPFRSRLVHQERAADLVTPMVDSVDVPVQQPDLDDAAYDAPVPALYVYRQRRGADQHVGVVCDVHREAFRDRQVRGHEAVQPERVAALVRHFATAPARAELVALLHHAGPVYTRSLAEAMSTEPLVRFDGPAGLEQEVWLVPEPTAAALADELGAATHYIADGHHRVAATVAGWQAAGGVPEAGLPCVVYPMDGLSLSSFHRRVPGPMDADRVLEAFGSDFVVEPAARSARLRRAASGCTSPGGGRPSPTGASGRRAWRDSTSRSSTTGCSDRSASRSGCCRYGSRSRSSPPRATATTASW